MSEGMNLKFSFCFGFFDLISQISSKLDRRTSHTIPGEPRRTLVPKKCVFNGFALCHHRKFIILNSSFFVTQVFRQVFISFRKSSKKITAWSHSFWQKNYQSGRTYLTLFVSAFLRQSTFVQILIQLVSRSSRPHESDFSDLDFV